MTTRSRDQGRTAGVGSVKRPSPGFGAMGETRRNQPFRSSDLTAWFDPKELPFVARETEAAPHPNRKPDTAAYLWSLESSRSQYSIKFGSVLMNLFMRES